MLENRRKLHRGIFVDKEYSVETSRNRKLLKPIFNTARKMEKYKGKCRLDADKLIVKGVEYTKDNLAALPEDISTFCSTSKSENNITTFFGELNPLSNFYPTSFEYNDIVFHSSEQLIQYMKAVYFEDSNTATSILNCDNALECKHLARNITKFNRDEWIKVAGDMCDTGIYEKFNQNKHLANILINTGSSMLVEASRDRDWGCGVSLYDDRCLAPQTWYAQGLLGQILEEVRRRLTNRNNIKGSNDDKGTCEEHIDTLQTDPESKS